jgi:hypothetical protein
VPNFGVDHDVIQTQNSISNEEKRLSHPWKPVQDDNGVWIVPSTAVGPSNKYFSAVQLDAET